jgi:hypothetical protein
VYVWKDSVEKHLGDSCLLNVNWLNCRSDGRFWPVELCCAVVRRKSANLRLVSMRSDTVLPQ